MSHAQQSHDRQKFEYIFMDKNRDVVDTPSIDASHISVHRLLIHTNWSLINTSKGLWNSMT